ncbi:TetR/AcrR family transcriptional regulator [Mangrovicella endophytica]|uniref:TetR/AcrR family transcriptional regulator n=1 Tax=Mangrovicella endophytica TaxID=2066697 RepID=UPI0018E470BF|nr:TetR/AcrR family transcriptional regulator [Mangrovicella endophytica]
MNSDITPLADSPTEARNAAEQPAAPGGRCPGGSATSAVDLDNPKVRDVLQAARSLFLAGAYDAVSTDAIARAAGISKATLYSHFGSKEHLFSILIGEECRSIQSRLPEQTTADDDIEAVLTEIARSHITILTSPDALSFYRSVVAQVPRFPELGRIFFETGPCTMLARIADALSQADRAGCLVVPDIGAASTQFMSLIAGDVPMRVLLGFAPPTVEEWEKRIGASVALFLGYYRAASHRA